MMMATMGVNHRRSSSRRRLSPAIVVALGILLSYSSIRGISANVSAPSSVSVSSSSRAQDEVTAMDVINTIRGGDNHVHNKRWDYLPMKARLGKCDTTTIRRGGGIPAGAGREVLPTSAPNSSKVPLLSKSSSIIVSIIATSINIASGIFVSSGYFGAYIASWIIRTIHHEIIPNMVAMIANNEEATGGGGGAAGGTANIKSSSNNLLSLNFVEGKYRWSSIATLLTILLHVVIPFTISNPNNIHGLIDKFFFTTTLWVYSHVIDPLLGGAIGMAHVALEGLSMLLGNQRLRNTINRLGGEWRLKKLNQYTRAEGEEGVVDDDVYIDPMKAIRPVRLPALISTSASMATAIVNGMGSASILLVFPQYFLCLYMLGSSFIWWWSNYDKKSSKWCYLINRFVQWLGEGGAKTCVSYNSDAQMIYVGCGLGEHIDSPWKLATRLVVLYWMTILSKTLVVLVVLSRIDDRSN